MKSEKEHTDPYIPIYKRPPNKFIDYGVERFDDGCGHTANIITAIFLDKKKEAKSMVAFVEWD